MRSSTSTVTSGLGRYMQGSLVPNGSDRGQFVVAALLGVATPPGLSGLSVVETQGARVDLEGLE